MRVAFKKRFGGFKEKEIDILLNFGMLQSLCADLGIEFWQIDASIKKDSYSFMTALMYWGYVTDCKEHYRKPEYTKEQAIIWYEHLSVIARKELEQKMIDLSGEIKKISGPKKKVS